MPTLEGLLGSTPRTKVAEALLRLGDLRVSRAEIAREAGLFRASTNRILADFEAEGIVTRSGDETRPMFQANPNSPSLLLLARFTAALELVQLTAAEGAPAYGAPHPTIAAFTSAIQRITGTAISGSGSAITEGQPTVKITTPTRSSAVYPIANA